MNQKCKELLTKGNQALNTNNLHNALRYFDKVTKWHPKCEGINQVHKIRLFILERTNQLEKAKALSNKLKNLNDIGFQRVRAIVLNRSGEQDNSLNLAFHLLNKPDLDNKSNQELHFLVASIYDKKNETDKAYKYFEKANETIRNSSENQDHDKSYLLNFIDLMENNFLSINKTVPIGNNNDPVFLVGFPRSGNTLLNTILNSHSNTTVIDEKGTFPVSHRNILRDGKNAIDHFVNLSGSQIEEYKGIYYSEASKYLNNPDDLIIDKLPLRFIDVGIINKIFPNAKYIFTVRHPLDCTLSCFMQNFEINDSMTNFYTLKESIDFYYKAMNLWKKYVENLDMNVYYIYYENLINNFEEEIKKMVDFLNLELDEKMFQYYEYGDTSTNTPSYNQVIRKPYRDSMYRYERYYKYMEPYIDKIGKFIKYFGYQEKGVE